MKFPKLSLWTVALIALIVGIPLAGHAFGALEGLKDGYGYFEGDTSGYPDYYGDS